MKTTKTSHSAHYLKESFKLETTTVNVKFDIEVNGYSYTVSGFYNLKTKEFTAELIGVFSVYQFATEIAGVSIKDLAKFYDSLQKIVVKEMK